MKHLKMKHNPPEMEKYACVRSFDKSSLKTEYLTNVNNVGVLEKFTV